MKEIDDHNTTEQQERTTGMTTRSSSNHVPMMIHMMIPTGYYSEPATSNDEREQNRRLSLMEEDGTTDGDGEEYYHHRGDDELDDELAAAGDQSNQQVDRFAAITVINEKNEATAKAKKQRRRKRLMALCCCIMTLALVLAWIVAEFRRVPQQRRQQQRRRRSGKSNGTSTDNGSGGTNENAVEAAAVTAGSSSSTRQYHPTNNNNNNKSISFFVDWGRRRRQQQQRHGNIVVSRYCDGDGTNDDDVSDDEESSLCSPIPENPILLPHPPPSSALTAGEEEGGITAHLKTNTIQQQQQHTAGGNKGDEERVARGSSSQQQQIALEATKTTSHHEEPTRGPLIPHPVAPPPTSVLVRKCLDDPEDDASCRELFQQDTFKNAPGGQLLHFETDFPLGLLATQVPTKDDCLDLAGSEDENNKRLLDPRFCASSMPSLVVDGNNRRGGGGGSPSSSSFTDDDQDDESPSSCTRQRAHVPFHRTAGVSCAYDTDRPPPVLLLATNTTNVLFQVENTFVLSLPEDDDEDAGLDYMALNFVRGGVDVCPQRTSVLYREEPVQYIADCDQTGVAAIDLYVMDDRLDEVLDDSIIPTLPPMCSDPLLLPGNANLSRGNVCAFSVAFACDCPNAEHANNNNNNNPVDGPLTTRKPTRAPSTPQSPQSSWAPIEIPGMSPQPQTTPREVVPSAMTSSAPTLKPTIIRRTPSPSAGQVRSALPTKSRIPTTLAPSPLLGSTSSSPQPQPPEQSIVVSCHYVTFDQDGDGNDLDDGAYVHDEWRDEYGFLVYAEGGYGAYRMPMVVENAFGHSLIVPQQEEEEGEDESADNPTGAAASSTGSILFDFSSLSAGVGVQEIGLLNVGTTTITVSSLVEENGDENDENEEIKTEAFTVEPSAGASRQKVNVAINIKRVTGIEVDMDGPSAVSHIAFCNSNDDDDAEVVRPTESPRENTPPDTFSCPVPVDSTLPLEEPDDFFCGFVSFNADDDRNDLTPGLYVSSTTWQDYGFRVCAEGGYAPNGSPRLAETAAGNFFSLIVQTSDEPNGDPEASQSGIIFFDFNFASTSSMGEVLEIGLVNASDTVTITVSSLVDDAERSNATKNDYIQWEPPSLDLESVPINVKHVTSMKVDLGGPAALSHIVLCRVASSTNAPPPNVVAPSPPPTTPAPSAVFSAPPSPIPTYLISSPPSPAPTSFSCPASQPDEYVPRDICGLIAFDHDDDGNNLYEGMYPASSLWQDYGFHVCATGGYTPNGSPRIVDSDVGNALIVQDPDVMDDGIIQGTGDGGMIYFDFNFASTPMDEVNEIILTNVEDPVVIHIFSLEHENGTAAAAERVIIKAEPPDGELFVRFPVPINARLVTRIEVDLGGPAGVAFISICKGSSSAPPTTAPPTTASPTTASPTTAPPTTASPTTTPPSSPPPTTAAPSSRIVMSEPPSQKQVILSCPASSADLLVPSNDFCGSIGFDRDDDGNELVAGTYPESSTWQDYGFRVCAEGGYTPNGSPRIYDSAIGKALIVQRPDDAVVHEGGAVVDASVNGVILFDFSFTLTPMDEVREIVLTNIEDNVEIYVFTLFEEDDGSGSTTTTEKETLIEVEPPEGELFVRYPVPINATLVTRVEVHLGSAGVAYISICRGGGSSTEEGEEDSRLTPQPTTPSPSPNIMEATTPPTVVPGTASPSFDPATRTPTTTVVPGTFSCPASSQDNLPVPKAVCGLIALAYDDDGNELGTGSYPESTLWQDYGFRVCANGGYTPNGSPRVFDSAIGKALIVQSSDVVDSAIIQASPNGATIVFDFNVFSNPFYEVREVILTNISNPAKIYVHSLFDAANGTNTKETSIAVDPPPGDLFVRYPVTINIRLVTRLEVHLGGPAGIAHISICSASSVEERAPVPSPSPSPTMPVTTTPPPLPIASALFCPVSEAAEQPRPKDVCGLIGFDQDDDGNILFAGFYAEPTTWQDYGFRVCADGGHTPQGSARIFDTAVGKALMVQSPDVDGAIIEPSHSGVIVFDFSFGATPMEEVLEVILTNIERPANISVFRLENENSAITKHRLIEVVPPEGEMFVRFPVPINEKLVTGLEVDLGGPAGVAYISVCRGAASVVPPPESEQISPRPTTLRSSVPSLPRPTPVPVAEASLSPSAETSGSPNKAPSAMPTRKHSILPSTTPTAKPSEAPNGAPSAIPTRKPSSSPSKAPSVPPTVKPTAVPSKSPNLPPSVKPTAVPSQSPSAPPTVQPTTVPTADPSVGPSGAPSQSPSVPPSSAPTEVCAQATLTRFDGSMLWKEELGNPIEILDYDNATVTFRVSQLWDDSGAIEGLSVFYHSDVAVSVCESRRDVPPGPLPATHIAFCNDGVAEANIFVLGHAFDEQDSRTILCIKRTRYEPIVDGTITEDEWGRVVFEMPCDCPGLSRSNIMPSTTPPTVPGTSSPSVDLATRTPATVVPGTFSCPASSQDNLPVPKAVCGLIALAYDDDGNELGTGSYPESTLWQDYGFRVCAHGGYTPNGSPRVFDSAIGKALIVQSSDVVDSAIIQASRSGVIVFDFKVFSSPFYEVREVILTNISSPAKVSVFSLLDANSTTVEETSISVDPPPGDLFVRYPVTINEQLVTRLEVHLGGPAGIAHISICSISSMEGRSPLSPSIAPRSMLPMSAPPSLPVGALSCPVSEASQPQPKDVCGLIGFDQDDDGNILFAGLYAEPTMWQDYGFRVCADGGHTPQGSTRIFDTAVGKALMVQSPDVDGAIIEPSQTGVIVFDFDFGSSPMEEVHEIILTNLESPANISVLRLENENSAITKHRLIEVVPPEGEMFVRFPVPLNEKLVTSIEVDLGGPAGIAYISICRGSSMVDITPFPSPSTSSALTSLSASPSLIPVGFSCPASEANLPQPKDICDLIGFNQDDDGIALDAGSYVSSTTWQDYGFWVCADGGYTPNGSPRIIDSAVGKALIVQKQDVGGAVVQASDSGVIVFDFYFDSTPMDEVREIILTNIDSPAKISVFSLEDKSSLVAKGSLISVEPPAGDFFVRFPVPINEKLVTSIEVDLGGPAGIAYISVCRGAASEVPP